MRMGVKTILSAAVMVLLALSVCRASVERVRAIEFSGIKYLSKAAIIKRSNIRSEEKEIIVDTALVEKALKSFPIIESFSVKTNKDRLVIKVAEREPLVIAQYVRSGETVTFEIDSRFNIIEINRVHDSSLPVLNLNSGGLVKGQIDHEAVSLCRVLKTIKRKHSALYTEINNIYYDDKNILVTLRRRRTAFYLRHRIDDFVRLAYTVGYLDRKGQYPEMIRISGDHVLIRRGV